MGRFRAGVSRKDITPPVGTPLSGYIRRFGHSTGIHDPLYANLLWVTDGSAQVLFVSLDLMNIDGEFSSRTKAAIKGELGIPEENVLIAAIHTHAAPGMHILREGARRDRAWEERVLEAVVAGSRDAVQKSQKALMGTGFGQAVIGYNRRKPGGPLDPSLAAAGFFDESQELFSLVVNYACHPVVLAEDNLLISADYVGYFRDFLEKVFPSGVTTLFFTGPAGDVDPVERGSFRAAERLARVLSAETQGVVKEMKPRPGRGTGIKTARARLKLPYGWIPSADEAERAYRECLLAYQEAAKRGDRTEAKIQKAFLLWAEELREKARNGELPRFLECGLQAVKVGEAVFLAFPFELFSSLSLKMRKRSGIRCLFLVGYANGYHGYLADEASLREGGYEVEDAFKYTGLLPLSGRAGDIFLARALSLLENLTRE